MEPLHPRLQQTPHSPHRDMAHEVEANPPALWDWENLLDFTIDDQFAISFDNDEEASTIPQAPAPGPEGAGQDRVRKRDPRLTCSNFLAGRVPCACPEIDEMLLEVEEEGGPGKKRARTVRSRPATAWCQVRGCEADISELKGYHRRHRVCLRCANASSVLIGGENKRYCQQCGKFHVLSDFDEDKRSCRRKLERHNNRRRRKSNDSGVEVEREPQEVLQGEDLVATVACDVEARKDSLCFSSDRVEKEVLLESEDGQVTTICSAPNSQNINSASVASFVTSGETQINGGKDNSKYSLSSSFCNNKNAYSSMCPTGRISFKLYDWNPAEFPRRLRHQIFEWLANMPIELEGYIRPGCTILTAFVAMPKFMWGKLSEDPMSCVHDFVVKPGMILSGRGTMLVYLNNMIFRVVRDGSSVMEVKVELRAPRLHYVHPTCFEAGKPMEFVACGSNLRQPKFRFLLSFSGRYLVYDCSVASPSGQSQTEGDAACNFDHQLYKIYVPHTEPNLFGPAFIEVENQSGLSNYIPVLIGDKEICSEMKILQQRVDASLFSNSTEFAAVGPLSDFCEASALRQKAFSELILDIAWLLKEPASENFPHILTTVQIQRFNSLLNYLICNESTIILEKILQNLKIVMDNMEFESVVNDTNDADQRLLQNLMDYATDILHQKLQKSGPAVLYSGNCVSKKDQCCSQNDLLSVVPVSNQDVESGANGKLGVEMSSTPIDNNETVSLLNREAFMNMNPTKEWPRQSCGRVFSGRVYGTRPTILVIITAAVCFGICAVILHPQKVRHFAVSIRRGLFDKT